LSGGTVSSQARVAVAGSASGAIEGRGSEAVGAGELSWACAESDRVKKNDAMMEQTTRGFMINERRKFFLEEKAIHFS